MDKDETLPSSHDVNGGIWQIAAGIELDTAPFYTNTVRTDGELVSSFQELLRREQGSFVLIVIHTVDGPREITPYLVEGNILGGDDQSPPAIAHAWREAGGFVRPPLPGSFQGKGVSRVKRPRVG